MMCENTGIVKVPLIFLNEGCAANPEMIHIIEYKNLCTQPEKTIRKVYEFLEKPYYDHNFENVEYSNENFDRQYNLKNFHTVKKRVDYKPPRCILPPEIVKKYEEMNLEFWRSEKKFIDYK